MTTPARATAAGRAYLDLRRKARQDRRPVGELVQLYVLECFLARPPGRDPCAAYRPVSARFENGFAVTGRHPLIRSRCTFWPRSTSPRRLAVPARPAFVRGRLPPAPASPGTSCPPASPGRCDDPAAKVSHLHSTGTAPRGAQFPREISTRRLQDLIRPPQLTHLALQLRDLLPVLRRRARPVPGIDSAWLTQLRSVSGLMPSCRPTCATAPRPPPDSARNSRTIFTARSRSSAGNAFLDTMSPNLPRGHGLHESRGGPDLPLHASHGVQVAGGHGPAPLSLRRRRDLLDPVVGLVDDVNVAPALHYRRPGAEHAGGRLAVAGVGELAVDRVDVAPGSGWRPTGTTPN